MQFSHVESERLATHRNSAKTSTACDHSEPADSMYVTDHLEGNFIDQPFIDKLVGQPSIMLGFSLN